jgi:N-methylhydantoinase B
MAGPGFNAVAQVPPRGFGGGYPGSAATWFPIRETNIGELLAAGLMPSKERLAGRSEASRAKLTHLALGRDDVFVAVSGGGGGLGDPLLRAPALVAADVAAGYVTSAHATAAYGLVLGDDGAVDAAATADRRAAMRRERIGGEPERELAEPGTPGAVVAVTDTGGWECGSCGTGLAGPGENWRTAARESPIADSFGELEMLVRDRTESPRVILREHFCPACACGLGVDVVTEGLDPLPAPRLEAAAAPAPA